MGKPGQSRQAKLGEKGVKVKKVKMPLLIHFIHPKVKVKLKVQKYIALEKNISALELHLMSLRINSIPI
jgi:hypothetical protein